MSTIDKIIDSRWDPPTYLNATQKAWWNGYVQDYDLRNGPDHLISELRNLIDYKQEVHDINRRMKDALNDTDNKISFGDGGWGRVNGAKMTWIGMIREIERILKQELVARSNDKSTEERLNLASANSVKGHQQRMALQSENTGANPVEVVRPFGDSNVH